MSFNSWDVTLQNTVGKLVTEKDSCFGVSKPLRNGFPQQAYLGFDPTGKIPKRRSSQTLVFW